MDPPSRERTKTVPRCQECLGEAEVGGPIVPKEDVARAWPWCAFGDGWRWCATFERFKQN